MADEVAALIAALHDTISPDASQRRQAERMLEAREKSPGYLPLLIDLMSNSEVPAVVQQQAAITFKNAVKRLWGQYTDDEAQTPLLTDSDKVSVKAQIVNLMLDSPKQVQRQLSEAIAGIAKYDFPHDWRELLPMLSAKLTQPDFHAINGVLRTAKPLFSRYCYEERSDRLWSEIKYVLETFAQPLTDLFKGTLQLILSSSDPRQLEVLFSSLELICEIFYSLNFQDLPAFFSDHMDEWMDGFATILTLPDNPALANDDSEKPSCIDLVKTQVCNNLNLYGKKYDEDFVAYRQRFAEIVWHLLTTTSTEVRFDGLASSAMQFLACMAEGEATKAVFGDMNTLRAICEQVISPNLQFRDVDMEVFESDPEEYILRDMEGSDVETRRRAAFDLVRALCKFWENEVTQVFSEHIGTLLQRYSTNPAVEWRSKDVAEYLVGALAIRKRTAAQGTTETNALLDVVDIFRSTILPDLQGDDVNTNPVLRADAIKYVINFRAQLPKEIHVGLIPILARHLNASSIVVNSYAAAALERQMALKKDGVAVITQAEVAPHLSSILEGLFGALSRPDNAENEYMMKAIMRSLATASEAMAPYLGIIVEKLSQTLMMVARNPSKPRFNHFLFEAFAAGIRFTCTADEAHLASFEAVLFEPFGILLQSEVLEFQPYVFQLLSLMLELRRSPGLPEAYTSLFPFLLQPTLWESGANTVPLTRLLQAYVSLGKDSLFPDPNELTKLLGVFRKLIASRVYDTEGFKLITTIVEHMSLGLLQPYLSTVLNLMMMRMQSSRTAKFVHSFFVFTCFLCGKLGGSFVVALTDGMQPGLFQMLLKRLFEDGVKDLPAFSNIKQKTCVVGLINLLTETPEMLTTYAALWPQTMTHAAHIITLIFGARQASAADLDVDDVDPDLENNAGGYRATYAQLAFAAQKEHDPFADVANIQAHFGQKLSQLAANHRGQIAGMIPAEAQAVVQSCLQAAGVGALP